jgi:hypothetical protein
MASNTLSLLPRLLFLTSFVFRVLLLLLELVLLLVLLVLLMLLLLLVLMLLLLPMMLLLLLCVVVGADDFVAVVEGGLVVNNLVPTALLDDAARVQFHEINFVVIIEEVNFGARNRQHGRHKEGKHK